MESEGRPLGALGVRVKVPVVRVMGCVWLHLATERNNRAKLNAGPWEPLKTPDRTDKTDATGGRWVLRRFCWFCLGLAAISQRVVSRSHEQQD